jgi:hypothetical protein
MRQIRRHPTEFDAAMSQLGQALDTAKTLEAELHELEIEIRRFKSLVIQTSATPNKKLPHPAKWGRSNAP